MKPITVTLQASAKLTILLATAWLFFSAILFVMPLPFLWVMMLQLLSLLSVIFFILRDALLKLPFSVNAIRLDKLGGCSLTQQNGREIEVEIAADTYVGAYLTLLYLIPLDCHYIKFWQHRYIILLQDSVQSDLFRELRVNLLWGNYKKEKPHATVGEV